MLQRSLMVSALALGLAATATPAPAQDNMEKLGQFKTTGASMDMETIPQTGDYADGLSYGDVYKQNEVEQSTYNFEHSDADFLFSAFAAHEKQAKHLMQEQLALPAYEQVLKAAHSFNLLDARGAISVTERAAYIGRIRNLARAVAQSYYDSRERLGFPMAPREWVAQIPTTTTKKAA